MTITEIKKKMKQAQFSHEEIDRLRNDDRKGVQKLISQYDSLQMKQAQLKKQYEEMMVYEKESYYKGKAFIAGIDEAGRGPLAGPVVAAAVILPEGFYLEGLNDSKKLSLDRREQFFEEIINIADTGRGIVTSEEIDRLNIYQATKLAMKRAVNNLIQTPDHLLIDAVTLEDVPLSQTNIVKGDQKSVSIAAASVIAKVTRDRMMTDLHSKYPMYQFVSNQGYGTKAHLEALETHGPSPYHRRSFAPVKDLITMSE
ncbi:ribonuclease HII [Halobacillus mangrovi]|uniref:Ribonuclease HII n=2 Tax=Halobacillus mangrovi TaxID=402384 RepID=A0A1W6A0X4_9BACI|nr:ribonuclease HII [Halobacillus mangrovi]